MSTTYRGNTSWPNWRYGIFPKDSRSSPGAGKAIFPSRYAWHRHGRDPCGAASLAGIARWAKKLTVEQLREFDIKRKRGPCHSAMHNLFSRLSVQDVKGALGEWSNGLLGDKAPGRIAVDGKTLCASKGAEYPALHLLAAFCADIHGVLRQVAVGGKANEITAAKAMLGRLPLKGSVVTGDAMFCQKEFCRKITEGGGDFIFTVKGNQPGLKEDEAATFSAAFSPCGGVAR